LWLNSHNGSVANWNGPAGTGVALRRQLSDASFAATEGATDSEVLFGLVLDAIADGEPAPDAVAAVVRTALHVAPDSRLNLLLTDGATVIATALGATLFTRHDAVATVVASEPFDDSPGWQQVPDGSLVVADRTDLTVGAIS
jgi:glutamine amidotransferase